MAQTNASKADRDSMSAIERSLIAAFVAKDRQERLLNLVGRRGAREKFRRELLDLSRMESRFVRRIAATDQNTGAIHQLLIKAGAPADCHVVSENPDWDEGRMPLKQALDRVVGAQFATLVVCRPESLLYYEGEAVGSRAILSRP
jgi:hypothetical protein